MIYWFSGQPGSGKTTLAKRLKKYFDEQHRPAIHLDGDDLRTIYGNSYSTNTFTKEYRNENTRALQRLVTYLADQGVNVIVSTVNPYREVRDEFKASRKDVIEIYVFCEGRIRQEYWVKDYEPPMGVDAQCKWINTTDKTEEESFKIVHDLLKQSVRIVKSRLENGTAPETIEYFYSDADFKQWYKEVFSQTGGYYSEERKDIIK